MFGGEKLWQISDQKRLVSKSLVNSCLLSFFISQDIVKIWMVKFAFTKVFLLQKFALYGISSIAIKPYIKGKHWMMIITIPLCLVTTSWQSSSSGKNHKS